MDRPIRWANLAGKIRREQADVVAALAQRRHLDGKNVEPVIEILAEFAFPRRLLEIAIGGGDHANVDFLRPRAAHGLKLPFLQHAQQLDLEVDGQLADLVEKDRATVGERKATFALFCRAGKGALFMAEQLAFDQSRGGIAAQLTLINGFSRRRLFL